jgi:anti-sigma factor RsiW
VSSPASERHLGELAAAVTDGVLGHHARERALVHLASCPQCRAEVEAQRQLKSMLSGLGGPDAPLSLADRLRAIPDASPDNDDDPGYGSHAGMSLPDVRMQASFRDTGADNRRRPRGGPRSSRRHTVIFGATGGFAAFAVSLGVVAIAGAPEQAEVVRPPVMAYTVEHSRSAGLLPGGDPALNLDPAAFDSRGGR